MNANNLNTNALFCASLSEDYHDFFGDFVEESLGVDVENNVVTRHGRFAEAFEGIEDFYVFSVIEGGRSKYYFAWKGFMVNRNEENILDVLLNFEVDLVTHGHRRDAETGMFVAHDYHRGVKRPFAFLHHLVEAFKASQRENPDYRDGDVTYEVILADEGEVFSCDTPQLQDPDYGDESRGPFQAMFNYFDWFNSQSLPRSPELMYAPSNLGNDNG